MKLNRFLLNFKEEPKVEEFVRYIDKLNSEDRMNLFHVVNASLGEKGCELTLSIKSSEPELSSDWLISCKDCLKVNIDRTKMPAHEITIKYGIIIIGSSYITGSYFKAVRLHTSQM